MTDELNDKNNYGRLWRGGPRIWPPNKLSGGVMVCTMLFCIAIALIFAMAWGHVGVSEGTIAVVMAVVSGLVQVSREFAEHANGNGK